MRRLSNSCNEVGCVGLCFISNVSYRVTGNDIPTLALSWTEGYLSAYLSTGYQWGKLRFGHHTGTSLTTQENARTGLLTLVFCGE